MLSIYERARSKFSALAATSAVLHTETDKAAEQELLTGLNKQHCDRDQRDIRALSAWIREVHLPLELRKQFDLDLLFEHMQVLPSVTINQLITFQGDSDACFYVILKGACALYHADDEGTKFEPEPEFSPTYTVARAAEARALVLRRLDKTRMREGKRPVTKAQGENSNGSPHQWARRMSWRQRRLVEDAHQLMLERVYDFGRQERKRRAKARALAQQEERRRQAEREHVAQERLADSVPLLEAALNARASTAPQGVEPVAMTPVVAHRATAALVLQAQLRGRKLRKQSNLDVKKRAVTRLQAAGRRRIVLEQLVIWHIATTHLQACCRGMASRARARRRRLNPSTPSNLQVRRVETLRKGSCFDETSLVNSCKAGGCVVTDTATDFVRIDSAVFRHARAKATRQVVDHLKAFLRSLPAFEVHHNHAVKLASEQAAEQAETTAKDQGKSRVTQQALAYKAAKVAAANAAVRAEEDVRSFASNVEQTTHSSGDLISVEHADILLIKSGEAILMAKDEERRFTLQLLTLSEGGAYAAESVAQLALPNIEMRAHPECKVVWIRRKLALQVLGAPCWQAMLAQTEETSDRIGKHTAAFAKVLEDMNVPPPRRKTDLSNWWRGGPYWRPPDYPPPLVNSEDSIGPAAVRRLAMTPAETAVARERITRKDELQENLRNSAALLPLPLIPTPSRRIGHSLSRSLEHLHVVSWCCTWCGSTAELGKGLGPDGQVSLCCGCARQYRSGSDGPSGSRKAKSGSSNGGSNEYTCLHCRSPFSSAGSLTSHVSLCKPLRRSQTVDLGRIPQSEPDEWRCSWCSCPKAEAVRVTVGPKGQQLCSLCLSRCLAGQRQPEKNNVGPRERKVKTQDFTMDAEQSARYSLALRFSGFTPVAESIEIGKPAPTDPTPRVPVLHTSHQSHMAAKQVASGALQWDPKNPKPGAKYALELQASNSMFELSASGLVTRSPRKLDLRRPRSAAALAFSEDDLAD